MDVGWVEFVYLAIAVQRLLVVSQVAVGIKLHHEMK